jgi:hypothetical protein
MSFAFQATEQEWSSDYERRTIRAVNIHRGDVSLVGMAANPATSAMLRADALTLEQRRKRAEVIGRSVRGPALWRDEEPSSDEACARCEGRGTIELNCPNCGRGSDGELEPSMLSASKYSDTGDALAEARMDLAAMRLGIPAPRRSRSSTTLDPYTTARADLARWRQR